jgi:GPH family glycoside/pentoside/hexuronide:cation symporter
MRWDPQMKDEARLGSEDRISLAESIGYGLGDAASCLYWQTFSLFLLNFYTDVFGLTSAAAGTMLLVTRIWDTALDPIMGGIADRTRSRFGRFRPWLAWGAVPFALAGILAFITPPFSPTGKLAYAYITYSLVMLSYTVVNIPYGALLGVISPSSVARTKLSSYRFFGAFTGNLIVQFTLLWLVARLGRGNPGLGYPLAMVIYGTVAATLFFIVFRTTRERVVPLATQKSAAREDVADLLGNRPWVVLGLMSLVLLIGASLRGAATIYYFKYHLRHGDDALAESGVWPRLREALASPETFWGCGTFATLAGIALTAWISKVTGGKKNAIVVLLIVTAVSLVAFQFAGPDDLALVYLTNIIGSLAGGPVFPLIWSMYADTADYAEWKTGRRATGLVFSTATFAQKLGWALGGSIAGWVLGAYGFKPNVVQTISALDGIRNMMGWFPATFYGAAALVLLMYDLDAKVLKRVEADLKERRGPCPRPEDCADVW